MHGQRNIKILLLEYEPSVPMLYPSKQYGNVLFTPYSCSIAEESVCVWMWYLLLCLYYLCAESWNAIGYGLFRILKLLASEGYLWIWGCYSKVVKASFPHNYLFHEAMIDVPCKSDPCFGGSGWCARRIIIAYSRTYDSLLYGAQHDVM